MKTKSRILAVILTLAMTFSMLPMTALAAEVVGPPQNQQLVTDPPKGEAGPTTGDPEVVPPTVPGPTDDTTPVAPPAELPAPPAENPGPVGPHDPGAGTRATNVCTVSNGTPSDINKEYATFTDALAAANTSSTACTITLTADCTYPSVSISKPLTITGTNQTLTGNAGAYITVNAAVTLNNINITTTGTNDIFHVYQPLTVIACDLTAENPTNGIFNMAGGSVDFQSGTANTGSASGHIATNKNGAVLKLKTGGSAVTALTGVIRLNDTGVVTLAADSTAIAMNIVFGNDSTHTTGSQIIACTADTTVAGQIAAQVTVNGNADWAADGTVANTITLKRLNNRYVLASGNDTSGDGTMAKPYATLQVAYDNLPDAGGEIRVLHNLTAAGTTTFGTANKNVTISTWTRYGNSPSEYRVEKRALENVNGAWSITRGSALTGGHLLNITAGNVTLDHIILDGGAIWDNPTDLKNRNNSGVKAIGDVANQLVMVNGAGAALTLDTGAVLQNNQRIGSATSGVTGGDTGSALCVVTGGAVTMNTGAKILNNDVTSKIGDSAAVSVWTDGTFNMTGGTITGNSSTRFGTIRVLDTGSGTMTMSGGEITGNAIHGKSIGGYTATAGGVYSVDNLTVSGTAKITGNSDLSGASAVPSNVTGKFAIGDNLADGANIGVTGAVGEIATTAESTDAKYVHSDDPELSVKYEASGTKLTLANEIHYYVSEHAAPGGNGSFGAPFQYLEQARNAIGSTAGTYNVHIIGEVRGTQNVYSVSGTAHATAGQLRALAGQTVNLIGDGAGAKILPTAGNSSVLYVAGTMTATNVVLQGFDQTTFVPQGGADSAVVYVNAGGIFTMGDKASIKGNYNTCTPATPLDAGPGWAGGSVYVKGTFNMETGSSITGGNGVNGYTTYSGGVVINGGTLNMTGGSISGNKGAGGAGVYVDGNGKINLSGTPIVTGNESNPGVANNIYLADGRVIGLTAKLDDGANIGVYTQSKPTSSSKVTIATAADGYGYTPADADAAYFHSDNAGDASVQFGGSEISLVKPTKEVYVMSGGSDTTGNGKIGNPYATLTKAYAQVSANGKIRVLSDLDVGAQTTFNSNKNVTIASYTRSGDGSTTPFTATEKPAGWTVKRIDGLKNQTAFIVSAGSVTLKNIVFDGGANWSSPDASALLTRTNTGITNVLSGTSDAGQLFTVNAGGALTLDSGAVLQNNDRQHGSPSGGDRGSAVYVNSGKLTMNTGASIKDNRVTNAGFGNIGDGAAVSVWYNGQFHMNGGSITGNTVGRMGGAIRIVTDSGTQADMYMSGGTISGNATKDATNGGGISVNGGYLHLSGAPVVAGNLQNAIVSNISFVENHLVMDGRLTGGSIGLWAASASEATNATATYNDLQYFHSDTLALAAQFKDNKIVLVDAATDTYVSNSGSDVTGDGTKANPFATIARAYGQVANNGTIHVMTDLAPTATTDFATAGKAVTITSCKANGDVWASAADTHTISRNVGGSLFTINKGTVTLTKITLTDKIHHVNAPICIGNAGDAASPKLVMATGATITGTESNFGAVYMFKGNMEMQAGSSIKNNTNAGTVAVATPQQGHGGGVYVASGATLAMTGGTITGNKCTVDGSRGGAVYAKSGAHFQVQGDVKIYGNTTKTSVGEGVYLMGQNLEVTGNLAATAHIDLGVDSKMAAATQIGTASGVAANNGITANLSAIVAAPLSPNLVAVRNGSDATIIQWAAADTNWLDWVAHADQSYGWKDSNTNLMPDGIPVNTPSKLYSLAYAIRENYSSNGASYANGAYKLTADLDLSGFAWQPIGITGKAFTGVFEGEGVHTITGISHKAGLTENGIFGVVAGPGVRDYPGGGSSWAAPYTTTLIQNLAVDGGGKTWTSSTAHHMGGIAAKATSATIQNCSVRNLTLKIDNTAASVFAGGIVGEAATCSILNNSVVKCSITPDANGADSSAYAGGIVGKAASTAISGNIVGGNNDNQVVIEAIPNNSDASPIYAGGVVGHMTNGSISNETWAHLNAMTVTAENFHADAPAYAGGVAGYLAGTATMTGCTPGANSGEKHLITAQGWTGFATGKNYAGGLVGGMEGTSSITSSTISASNAQSYTVTAGVGNESVAGGLVGTMVGTTIQSLTDCSISGDSIDSVKVTANGAAGTAGGLVGTAMDARVIKCNAQNITIAGGAASGGLAGTFAATAVPDQAGEGGLMAMCYERNCEVTGASHCDMIQTATNALILACYATKAAPQSTGVYAVKTATGSKFVGCYTTANQAPTFAYEGSSTYVNCYFVGTGTAADTDEVKGIPLTAFTDSNDATLRGFMNTELASAYNTVTGSLRMGYMAGQSEQMNGNYNYPVYAVYLLTVNSLPSSVYGTYTVTADSKAIATNATGFNQYWVGQGATVAVTGTKSDYADATINYKTDEGEYSTTAVSALEMNADRTVNVKFNPIKFPGWAINKVLHGNADIDYTNIGSTALTKTANKLTGNTVYSGDGTASTGDNDWPANARTIKTIFVTAATTTSGASNPTISAFTADGWTVATGGVGKAYVQLTNAQGANAAAVSAIVNSFAFAAEKTATGDVDVDVQVYVDETIRGAMYFFGGSVYELAGSAVGQPAAKALAENSTLGAKKGHLVVIGSSAEHAFLRDNVKTNAWTAAVTSAPSANAVGTWTWAGVTATDPETSYLQNQSSWAGGEPNNSGTYATYNYTGKFDDTNGANVALIEYDTLSTPSTAGWQAYSALAIGTVTCHVEVAVAPNPGPDVGPTVDPNPGKGVTNPHDNGVSKLLETDKHIAYMRGDDKGNFNPEKGITRAETAQMFYNLLKNKDIGEVAKFSDVEAAAWYADAVNTLAALKIIQGRDADQFAPDDNISRAEFTAIAMRFADSVKGQKTFTDVSSDYWAESYIAGAAQYGWIDGYGDGTFKPFGNIKRCEAAKIVNTMLWRFADTVYVDKAKNLKTFPDVATSDWAFYDIMEAANGHDFKQDKNGLETWTK